MGGADQLAGWPFRVNDRRRDGGFRTLGVRRDFPDNVTLTKIVEGTIGIGQYDSPDYGGSY